MAIITYPLNGIEYNAANVEIYLCTRTSGVFSAENHYSASITGDREITISPGLAWIRNGQYTGKSVLNDSDVTVAVPVADGALPRIDRIVLRFNKAANASSIILLQGAASSTPVAPDIQRSELVYDLALCDVYIPAASIAIAPTDLTSKLMDETVCGLMRDGVTGIPTAAFQAQLDQMIADLRTEIEQVHDGSAWVLKTEVESYVDPAGVNPVSGAAVAAYALPRSAIVATTADPGAGAAVDYEDGTVIHVYE